MAKKKPSRAERKELTQKALKTGAPPPKPPARVAEPPARTEPRRVATDDDEDGGGASSTKPVKKKDRTVLVLLAIFAIAAVGLYYGQTLLTRKSIEQSSPANTVAPKVLPGTAPPPAPSVLEPSKQP